MIPDDVIITLKRELLIKDCFYEAETTPLQSISIVVDPRYEDYSAELEIHRLKLGYIRRSSHQDYCGLKEFTISESLSPFLTVDFL